MTDTSEPTPKWDDEGMRAEVTGLETELAKTCREAFTAWELAAELLDNGKLEGDYRADERDVALYEGLHYSEERGSWVARFVPTRPERTQLTHTDSTYAETLQLARALHDGGVKPSQCFKALVAFDARMDREVAKLTL